MAKNHWAASPDRTTKLINLFAAEDYSCMEYTSGGTLTGEVDSGSIKLSLSGLSYEIQCCFVFHVTNSRIDRVHEYFDMRWRRPALPPRARVSFAGPRAERSGPAQQDTRASAAAARGGGRPGPHRQHHRDPGAAGTGTGGRSDQDSAAATLAEALTLACPQGYVRVFTDEGAPMGALLGRLVAAERAGQSPARDVTLAYLVRPARSFEPGTAATGPHAAQRPPRAGGWSSRSANANGRCRDCWRPARPTSR